MQQRFRRLNCSERRRCGAESISSAFSDAYRYLLDSGVEVESLNVQPQLGLRLGLIIDTMILEDLLSWISKVFGATENATV